MARSIHRFRRTPSRQRRRGIAAALAAVVGLAVLAGAMAHSATAGEGLPSEVTFATPMRDAPTIILPAAGGSEPILASQDIGESDFHTPAAPESITAGQRKASPSSLARKHSHVIEMVVTAYCPCPLCCGPKACGITASGKSVYTNGMKLVAADTRLMPFGTLVSIPGYRGGRAVPVLDRGAAIKGHRLDVLMPTHEAALRWGKKTLPVTVYDE